MKPTEIMKLPASERALALELSVACALIDELSGSLRANIYCWEDRPCTDCGYYSDCVSCTRYDVPMCKTKSRDILAHVDQFLADTKPDPVDPDPADFDLSLKNDLKQAIDMLWFHHLPAYVQIMKIAFDEWDKFREAQEPKPIPRDLNE